MINNHVLYLELDQNEGIYKFPLDINNNTFYQLGELFISSNAPEPHIEYSIRAYYKEKIIFDKIILAEKYPNNTYDYMLLSQIPEVNQFNRIYFRAYKAEGDLLKLPNLWILFELMPSPDILDELELHHDYNLIGETNLTL